MRFLRNKEGTIVAIILIILCIGIGIFAISSLGKYYFEQAVTQNEYKKIADEFHDGDNTETTPTVPEDPNKPLDPELLKQLADKYNKMHNANKDYVFWLSMEGINLELPVVSSANDRMSEYTYLTHNFNGKEDKNGCLFLSKNCTEDSDNIIIYGHNMHDGAMFGKLNRYSKTSFVKEHPLILIYFKDEIRYYEVISVFTCDFDHKPFNWEGYTYFYNVGQRVRYGNIVKQYSKITTNYQPGVHADKFLTLVTCEYTHNNGRLVVTARQIGTPKIEDLQRIETT